MHRYRDALIHIHQARDGEKEKTRPIYGAFVLYPAWVDESANTNPYREAIDQISIGAFPLLPNHPNLWFKEFLKSVLGDLPIASKSSQPFVYPKANPDRFFIEDAARIPYTGMHTVRYDDLTLVASVEKENERTEAYLYNFRYGTACWYHTQHKATERQSITRNRMREIKFCAVAVSNGTNTEKIIEYIYPVIDVKLTSRKILSVIVTGKEDELTNDKYWVFELGKAKKLLTPIVKPATEHFQLKLTKVKQLEEGIEWSELSEVYEYANKN